MENETTAAEDEIL